MKRSFLALTLLFVLCITLAGCCPPGVATLTVSEIPWPDEELTSYIIQDQGGDTIGSFNMTIHKENGTYILTQQLELTIENEQIEDNVIITVDATDLKPISEARTLSIPPGMIVAEGIWELNASYNAGQLTVETETPVGPEEPYTVDVAEDAFAHDQVLCLLRTPPYEDGYTASYTNIFIWPNIEMPRATITVTGRETVEVPAGSFDCYKLELSLENVPQKYYFWYGVNEPHYLVKYDNEFNIFLLTEHPYS
jgi:hypothetical protein